MLRSSLFTFSLPPSRGPVTHRRVRHANDSEFLPCNAYDKLLCTTATDNICPGYLQLLLSLPLPLNPVCRPPLLRNLCDVRFESKFSSSPAANYVLFAWCCQWYWYLRLRYRASKPCRLNFPRESVCHFFVIYFENYRLYEELLMSCKTFKHLVGYFFVFVVCLWQICSKTSFTHRPHDRNWGGRASVYCYAKKTNKNMLQFVCNEHPVCIVYNTPHESLCVVAVDDRGALFSVV